MLAGFGSLWRQNPRLSVHVPYGAPWRLLSQWPRRGSRRPQKASSVWRVEKPVAEEPSGRRFVAWVVRPPSWPSGGGLQPVDLTGVFWRSAEYSVRRPGHQGPRSPDMGGRHTCLRKQGERLQGAGWDIIRPLEGHKLCGKAAYGLLGTDGHGLATQRANALIVLLQADRVPGWGSPTIAACVTHPNTLLVRSPNSLFETLRLLYPSCALVALVCSSISQLWFARSSMRLNRCVSSITLPFFL
jgi:hypothetical protein